MKNKKVTKIIESINPDEMKLFRKFLQAEFHTSDNAALLLFEFIFKNYFDLPEVLRNPKRFTLEKAYKKVFPKEVFNERKIEHKCSDLSKLAEKFLIQQELKKSTFEQERLLVQALVARGAHQLAKARLKKAKAVLDLKSGLDETYYLDKTKLLLGQYFSAGTGKFNLKESETIFQELLSNIKSLIHLLQLQVGIEAKSRSGIFTTEFKMLSPTMTDKPKEELAKSAPVIHLYELAYLLIYKNERETYDQLEAFFFEMATQLAQMPLNTISSILLNFGFRNLDKKINRIELFALAKKIIEQGYLKEEGFFPAAYFTNIAILGAELKNTWTKNLLEYGEKHLAPATKAKTLTKCRAYYYFSKKEYDNALVELQKVPTTRINDRLQVSALELRCLYELHILETGMVMDEKIEAYRKLIGRKKNLNPVLKEQNLAFLAVLSKLYKVINLSDLEKKKLSGQVKSAKRIVARNWLLEKIDS